MSGNKIIKVNKKISEMDDDEFAKYYEPIKNTGDEFIKNVCLPYYSAFYLANLYYYDKALLNYDLNIILSDIIIYFNNINTYDIDINKVESILQKKYGLKFKTKDPVSLIEI